MECRTLTYDQVNNLKTAQALYECVPISIYTPFALYFLRRVAQANSGPAILRLCIHLTIAIPLVELSA